MIAESRVKTDKVDAKTLAELLRGGFLPTSYVPTKEIRELRHLVRHRIALGRFRARVKTQIKTELRRKNIKYPDGGGIFTGKGKKWLRSLKNTVIDSYLAIYEVLEKEIKEAESRIEKAGKEYEEVKLLTEDADANNWYNKGKVLLEMGHKEEAEECFEKLGELLEGK